MVYNRFSLILFLRVALILVNLIAISVLYDRSDLFYTNIFLVVFSIVQVVFLITYINTTNRELTKFVLAVKDSDNTAKFPDHSGSFSDLFRSFEQILDLLKSHETEKEAQLQYVQHIINTIDIAIVSIDSNHKIVLSNRSANHIREKYKFDGGKSFVDTLTNAQDTSIIKANSPFSGTKELMISSSRLRLLDESYTVFTLKDIKTQLETREIESWQKLIRILAHEIMNSVTPIASLSETMVSIIEKDTNVSSMEGKDLQSIRFSADTIKSRSEGLLTFLEDYRKLIKVPVPKKELIQLEIFCGDIIQLFESELTKEGIEVSMNYRCPEVVADKIQLEQVLVNLITNAIQALSKTENKQIEVVTRSNEKDCIVEIIDNGPGIDSAKIEKIFVPFYTTKNNGSGIGLSLSRQIINLHKGQLDVDSKPGLTNFWMKLPLDEDEKP